MSQSKISKIDVTKINALAELERVGWGFSPTGDDEISFCCPVHGDTNPSANLNITKNLWMCHSADCDAKGDFISLLAYILKCERKVIVADLVQRYPELRSKVALNPVRIEEWHDEIWGSGPLLKALRDRMISDETIKRRKLGFNEGRIIIPITDEKGRILTVRKYLPGAPGPEKMRNLRGYDSLHLYPADQLGYPTIWVCGGEMKALAAAQILNPHGIGAVTATGSEGSWDREFTLALAGKQAYVCMDVDTGGRRAANKISKYLVRSAQSVRIIHLPLDKSVHPKGDLNDWMAEGAEWTEFNAAMEHGDLISFDEAQSDEDEQVTETKALSLSQTIIGSNVGRLFETESMIVACSDAMSLPSRALVSCGKDIDDCVHCNVYPREFSEEQEGGVELRIRGTSRHLLRYADQPGEGLRLRILADAVGIPASCKSHEIKVSKHYTAREVSLAPPIAHGSKDTDLTYVPGILMEEQDEEVISVNHNYKITGKAWPHPRTHKSTLLVSNIDATNSTIADFHPSDEELEQLRFFQPDEWSMDGIQKMLDARYRDLAYNVTKIFGRDEMHLVTDLVYHSVLFFPMRRAGQQTMVPGWVNAILLGDTAQGKTEISKRLMAHYNAGTRFDCKNATQAGVLGGAQQINDKWIITWGVLPQNDRGLVIFEEFHGLHEEIIRRLTDVRSEGIADITRIKAQRAMARCRILFVCNPRSGKRLDQYAFGVSAIEEAMVTPEDMRRLDVACLSSSTDVDIYEQQDIHQEDDVEHRFTQDACANLVLWAWSRGDDQIIYEEGTEKYSVDQTRMLHKIFKSINTPLIELNTLQIKIMKLACALAALTFSTKDDDHVLYVRKLHVEYVTAFLKRLYSHPSFRMDTFATREEVTSHSNVEQMMALLRASAAGDALFQYVANNETADTESIGHATNTDYEFAKNIFFHMIQANVVRHRKKGVRSEYEFHPKFREACIQEYDSRMRLANVSKDDLKRIEDAITQSQGPEF